MKRYVRNRTLSGSKVYSVKSTLSYLQLGTEYDEEETGKWNYYYPTDHKL
ncbi:hypothetical protein RBU60_10790 [Mesonia sp. MT50]|uniref:Uncharacterized protein n=1 Tax=Mesonia profundi TaxID=3070998 RepID=A0ABU1A2Y3_9FLAO|nr:hypothetical protein [Mesonia profundi]MDQ7918064.1 hypothetical protein [Mesonia profundi]